MTESEIEKAVQKVWENNESGIAAHEKWCDIADLRTYGSVELRLKEFARQVIFEYRNSLREQIEKLEVFVQEDELEGFLDEEMVLKKDVLALLEAK